MNKKNKNEPCCCFHRCPGALVRVRIKGQRASLTPRQVSIERGATVSWKFSGVPEGAQPLLRFTAPTCTAENPAIGPFELLGSVGDRIVGLCAADVEGEQSYDVLLLFANTVQNVGGEGSVFIEAPMGGDEPDGPVGGYQ